MKKHALLERLLFVAGLTLTSCTEATTEETVHCFGAKTADVNSCPSKREVANQVSQGCNKDSVSESDVVAGPKLRGVDCCYLVRTTTDDAQICFGSGRPVTVGDTRRVASLVRGRVWMA